MLHQDHSALINLLLECALTCEMCATACLHEKEVTPMAHCILLNRDCADLCKQGATLLKRDSVIGHQFLLICEEICRMCYDECNKHSSNMDHCRICAEVCLKCAEACHRHHEPITQD